MPARVVRLFPEAEAEVVANERWYAQRSPSVATAFLAEVDQAIARIGETPETWPRYRRGTRRFILRRFPFSVVYRIDGDVVYVVAVAHAKRRPEYWRRRKRPARSTA
ncbi:MAG: type II toxin-antitoxin system RelE/ParE family toxin [Acidobacteria bacterium]|nr:type II toxin-antitoxin system RelE/ParE family toxin [Acidobacteriota bacterium]